MITESNREEVFIEATESSSMKVVAALAALIITAALFLGYVYLRKRQAQAAAPTVATAQPKPSPQALILVDEALIQGSNTVLGGTVKNTGAEKLNTLSVELELKRRKDGRAETRLVPLTPADLDPAQEGRYSLQLKAQDYIAAKVTGLHKSNSLTVPFTVAPGEKRPPERLDSKTIVVDKPAPGKRSEFLNSPDNPARVP